MVCAFGINLSSTFILFHLWDCKTRRQGEGTCGTDRNTHVVFMVFRIWHGQPACRLGISRSRSEIPICVLSISLWSLKLCSRVLILWGKSNQFMSLIPWLTIIMLGHAEWKQSELSAPCHLYGWIHLVCQITWINGSLRSNASL